MVDVDAEIGVRERDAAIEDEDVAVCLDGEAVHSDFVEPSERNETDGGRGRVLEHRVIYGQRGVEVNRPGPTSFDSSGLAR